MLFEGAGPAVGGGGEAGGGGEDLGGHEGSFPYCGWGVSPACTPSIHPSATRDTSGYNMYRVTYGGVGWRRRHQPRERRADHAASARSRGKPATGYEWLQEWLQTPPCGP